MNDKQKHTNLPMVVVVQQNHIRQEVGMATTITTWTSLINYFSGVFTAPTFPIFASLMTGWILCTARRTTTGIMPFADPYQKRPHDAFHRLFPEARNERPCWVVGSIRWCGSGICGKRKTTVSCPRFPGIPINSTPASRTPWPACDGSCGRNELKYGSGRRPYMIKFWSS